MALQKKKSQGSSIMYFLFIIDLVKPKTMCIASTRQKTMTSQTLYHCLDSQHRVWRRRTNGWTSYLKHVLIVTRKPFKINNDSLRRTTGASQRLYHPCKAKRSMSVGHCHHYILERQVYPLATMQDVHRFKMPRDISRYPNISEQNPYQT